MRDDDQTPRDIRELEAEATAMLVCAALQLPGIEESRAYIQHWYGVGNPIPEASARRIFRAADQILRAGRPELPAGDLRMRDDLTPDDAGGRHERPLLFSGETMPRMPTPDRVVFTVSVPRTLPETTWQQFADKTRAEGSDPRTILRKLIEFYLEKGLPQ